MSTIELKWKERVVNGAQTPRKFLDFVIDGNSLYEFFGDLISPFGWLSPDETLKAVDRLLLIDEADFPNNRRSIYICPECGDLGCGAISAVIERAGNRIIWRDFGYENNYDETVHFDEYRDLGPFSFDLDEYSRVIAQAATTNP